MCRPEDIVAELELRCPVVAVWYGKIASSEVFERGGVFCDGCCRRGGVVGLTAAGQTFDVDDSPGCWCTDVEHPKCWVYVVFL